MVQWWLLIEHSRQRCFHLFVRPSSGHAPPSGKGTGEHCKETCIVWDIISAIHEHAYHEEFMSGAGANGCIGEETLNLG